MAWTPSEKRFIDNLVLRIETLEQKVIDLQDCCNNATCSCDCKIYPHIVSIDTNYIYTDINNEGEEFENYKTAEELSIPHDRFPEPACSGEKGIITMWDVWLLCAYHEQDGWMILDHNKR